ncbi:hypothetical protein DENSPDRAFT_886635 [Dentipellis sp. KUC8613]|nr:hypothetical protein DENSPDRAFT_886635 [Dentipellis sp. KUC8613]
MPSPPFFAMPRCIAALRRLELRPAAWRPVAHSCIPQRALAALWRPVTSFCAPLHRLDTLVTLLRRATLSRHALCAALRRLDLRAAVSRPIASSCVPRCARAALWHPVMPYCTP